MAIVGAILEGERDPRKLAKLADKRVKATKQTIAKSLEGNWRPELLFVLEQELALYQMYRGKIEECGRKLEQHLHTAPSKVDPEAAPIGPRPKGKRAQGDHGDGPSVGMSFPPADHEGSAVCGQRDGILRAEIPRTAGSASPEEGSTARF